ncbi:LysR family transcriptional regulator [Longispora albida]|uniref:LysR family transcriptional regulator n=1 Tax=Longispora albida TaxID=203523 RepID=UPI000375F783|nr:LysR family transcriptional regulator [Longispora albida]
MELREIEIFLTLAEELHFGRAAERLRLTQSRVSQSIKKQERQLGGLLFDRNNRTVRLTDLGTQLRADLVPGYRQIQDAVARASATGRGFAGVLRVGVQSAWSGDLVLAAATAFGTANPDCDIQIREVPLSDPFGGLQSGQLDLQLTIRPAEEPGLTAGPLVFSLPRVLVVSSGHPLAQRQAISMEDLAGLDVVTVDGPPDYWIRHHIPARTPGGRPIQPAFAVAEWETAWSLVASGKGVFMAASWAADDRYHYNRPALAFVPIHDAPPLEWGLLWRTDAATVMLRSFAEAVVAQREAMPAGD